MPEITHVALGVPGPSGHPTAAQWAALQLIVDIATGKIVVQVTDTGAVQIRKADGTVLANFNTNSMLISAWNGASFVGFSNAGIDERFRLRGDNGHFITAGEAAGGSVASGGAAGSGATVDTFTGDDTSGKCVLHTGTGPGTGNLIDVDFHDSYAVAPSMILVGAGNSSVGGLGLYVTNIAVDGFTIGCKTAPPASTAMTIGWHVIG